VLPLLLLLLLRSAHILRLTIFSLLHLSFALSSELVLTTKQFMRTVATIEGAWLCEIAVGNARALLRFSVLLSHRAFKKKLKFEAT
jgi:hypothetical protein